MTSRLGKLLGQVIEPGFSKLSVTFEGHVSELNRKPLMNAALQGVLSSSIADVNAVNAGMLATERGIDVSEVARDKSDHFNNLIRLEVVGKDGLQSVSGTVFDGVNPRLVSIDGCEIEMAPAGRMIFIRNEDKPGVIAAMGAVLAKANINIGDFRLGREIDSASAIALISVDSKPDESVIEEMKMLEGLRTVRYVELET